MSRDSVRLWPLLAFTHRWLGIAGGLLFLLWFVSGIAMVYVRMPELSEDERLAHAAPLSVDGLRVSPRQAAVVTGSPEASAIAVGMLGARPVYRIGTRARRVVFADTGESLRDVSGAAAVDAALAFLGSGASAVRYLERLEVADQWSLQLGPHFPLHRLAVDDGAGTELYVSSLTGEVVLDTTRRERRLAYLGPVAHWLYLPVLRRNGAKWTQVILWTSGLGCVLCLSGLLTGLLRFSPGRRFRVQREPAVSPYSGWMKWHHYAGLIFGVVTLSWTFSGLLSMGPFPWLSHEGLAAGTSRAVAGTTAPVSDVSVDQVRSAVEALRASIPLTEMRLTTFQDRRYWIGTAAALEQRLVPASGPWTTFAVFPDADVEDAARTAVAAPAIDVTWLTAYDAYYYDRASRQPLPVVRARFADDAATWVYVDPTSGAVVLTVGTRDRLNRWLYHGLHSLDPAWLRDRRPLWDLVVIALSLGGIAGVATSLVPAWRRLRTLVS